jgi:hypothetical protein
MKSFACLRETVFDRVKHLNKWVDWVCCLGLLVAGPTVANGPSKPGGLALVELSLSEVGRLYAELSGRAVVLEVGLAGGGYTLEISELSDGQVLEGLRLLLRLRNVAREELPHSNGEYWRLMEDDQSAELWSQFGSMALEERFPRWFAMPSSERVRVIGLFELKELQVREVLSLLQEITGRVVVSDDRLPRLSVDFSAEPGATIEEAVRSLDRILHSAGMVLIEHSTDDASAPFLLAVGDPDRSEPVDELSAGRNRERVGEAPPPPQWIIDRIEALKSGGEVESPPRF